MGSRQFTSQLILLSLGFWLIVGCEERIVYIPSGGDVTPPKDSVQNRALEFLGTNGFVDITSSSLLRPGTFTVEIYVKFDTLHNGMIPLLSATGINQWNTADGFNLKYEAMKFYLTFATSSNNGTVVSKDTVAPLKKWIHFAATYDKTQMKLYLDGNLVALAPQIATVYYGGRGLTIGSAFHSSFGGWNYFCGQIDELRIWSDARTQSQIQGSMKKKLNGDESGLVGYWSFDQSPLDNYALDQSVWNNHGLMFGDVRFVASDVF